MDRSTVCRSAIGVALLVGGCAFTPGAESGASGSSGRTGAAGSTGPGTAGSGAGGSNQSIDAAHCGQHDKAGLKVPPDILIIQDASGSMNNDITDKPCNGGGCGASSKWGLMTPAINQVVMATQTTVNWGLKFFADTDNSCGVGAGVAVGVAANSATAIARAIAGRTSGNGGVTNGSRTPTRLAENAGAAYLAALTDGSPRYIVLATDGLPNCMPGNGDNTVDDSPGAVAAIKAAHDMGIDTFVVGIATAGMGTADTTLSNMATAGGEPRSGTPAYYSVSSNSEFETVLGMLAGSAGTCQFQIGPPPTSDGTTGLDAIDVFGDGMPILRDTTHQNGYDYTDASMNVIVIYGPECDAIKAGTIKDVTVTFRCKVP